MKRFIAISLLLTCLQTPVAAGPYEEAREALERGDYPTATKKFQQASDEFAAASELDGMDEYRYGKYPIAGHKLRKAADHGNPYAQAILGTMYAKGQGFKTDQVQAYFWCKLAANQGHADASQQAETLATQLSSEQLATAATLLHQWHPKAPAHSNAGLAKRHQDKASVDPAPPQPP